MLDLCFSYACACVCVCVFEDYLLLLILMPMSAVVFTYCTNNHMGLRSQRDCLADLALTKSRSNKRSPATVHSLWGGLWLLRGQMYVYFKISYGICNIHNLCTILLWCIGQNRFPPIAPINHLQSVASIIIRCCIFNRVSCVFECVKIAK